MEINRRYDKEAFYETRKKKEPNEINQLHTKVALDSGFRSYGFKLTKLHFGQRMLGKCNGE